MTKKIILKNLIIFLPHIKNSEKVAPIGNIMKYLTMFMGPAMFWNHQMKNFSHHCWSKLHLLKNLHHVCNQMIIVLTIPIWLIPRIFQQMLLQLQQKRKRTIWWYSCKYLKKKMSHWIYGRRAWKIKRGKEKTTTIKGNQGYCYLIKKSIIFLFFILFYYILLMKLFYEL